MYFAPYIDETGLHIPSYNDIAAYELAQFQSVYGALSSTDVSNADIQWVDIFSLLINDAFQCAQLVYNSRSPVTAVGGDLDAIVAINGIARKSASYSTAVLAIGGVAGKVINNGFAQDNNGYLWQLPDSVTIPNTGSVNVTATCTTIGNIAANAGTIANIATPTDGWNTVINPSIAVVGLPIENDSQLRARQAISTSLVSKTLIQSTIAGIAAVPNVTRYYNGPAAENPTGSVDSYGNPAHSISMVVEGGTDLAVATAIYNNKTPGCFTNGTTTQAVVDPISGVTTNISFFRPTSTNIYVIANVHGLVGFTSVTTTAIKTAIVTYLNALQIGESVTFSGLIAAAMAVMPNILLPQFSIQNLYLGTSPSPSTSTDIAINFNQVAAGLTANVTVNSI